MKEDEKEKEGVVIDVEPEREPDDDPKSEAPEQGAEDGTPPDEHESVEAEPAPRKSSGGAAAMVGVVIAILALLAVGGLAAFGYKQLQTVQTELGTLESRIAAEDAEQNKLAGAIGDASSALTQQTQQVASLADEFNRQLTAFNDQKKAFASQEKLLADERIRMEEREAELRATVSDVHQRMGRSGTEWMIAESEYLMRLAEHRLRLAGDAGTARAALAIADQRLRDTGDPGWAGVREQVARDIASLDVLETPDVSGLSARLAALSAEVPKLTLSESTGAHPSRPVAPGGDGASTVSSDDSVTGKAKKFLNDFWAGIKDSVRIRRHDKPVQAMLAPKHQFFLYENLRLQLETARIALVRGDQTLYRDALTRADKWLDDYFKPDDAATVAMRSALGELAGRQIEVQLPDISNSLRALQARQRLLARIGDLDRSAPAVEAEAEPAAETQQ